MLVALKSVDDPKSERVIVDPNQIDPSGHSAIDFYEPSIDGKLVAVSMSKGGSERGDVHIFDAVSGQPTGEVISHVNGGTAGGSLAWNADGSGVYYTHANPHGPASVPRSTSISTSRSGFTASARSRKPILTR